MAQYNLLSSGKSVLLQGLSLGYDYAVLGGQNETVSIPKNTVIMTLFPQRIGVYTSLAFRNYNLTGIIHQQTTHLK